MRMQILGKVGFTTHFFHFPSWQIFMYGIDSAGTKEGKNVLCVSKVSKSYVCPNMPKDMRELSNTKASCVYTRLTHLIEINMVIPS